MYQRSEGASVKDARGERGDDEIGTIVNVSKIQSKVISLPNTKSVQRWIEIILSREEDEGTGCSRGDNQ